MQDNQEKETSTDEVQTENERIEKNLGSGEKIPLVRDILHPSRLAPWPTQPPVQWVSDHSPG